MKQRLLEILRRSPVVAWSTVVIVSMFFVVGIGMRLSDGIATLYGVLALDPSRVLGGGHLWTLLTYSLIHSMESPFHVLFNALMLFWFGRDLEERWGSRRVALCLFLGVFVGGLAVLIPAALSPSPAIVVGASGGVMALVIAWGLAYRDREMMFFFVVKMKGIHLVYASIALEIMNAVSASGTSAAAHFGGMAAGAVMAMLIEPYALRREYLKLKLRGLSKKGAAARRAGGPQLRIVHGGDRPPKNKHDLN